MYTIKWTGLEPKEDGWSPPSDTIQRDRESTRIFYVNPVSVRDPRSQYSAGGHHLRPLSGRSRRVSAQRDGLSNLRSECIGDVA